MQCSYLQEEVNQCDRLDSFDCAGDQTMVHGTWSMVWYVVHGIWYISDETRALGAHISDETR